jgi:hypothetical protein
MSVLSKEKKTVDIIIKGLDAVSLIDIMDTIRDYKLKYSFLIESQHDCDNDSNFELIMEDIISEYNTLSISMKPLVNDAIDTFQYYSNNKDFEKCEFYENLIKKGNQILFTE